MNYRFKGIELKINSSIVLFILLITLTFSVSKAQPGPSGYTEVTKTRYRYTEKFGEKVKVLWNKEIRTYNKSGLLIGYSEFGKNGKEIRNQSMIYNHNGQLLSKEVKRYPIDGKSSSSITKYKYYQNGLLRAETVKDPTRKRESSIKNYLYHDNDTLKSVTTKKPMEVLYKGTEDVYSTDIIVYPTVTEEYDMDGNITLISTSSYRVHSNRWNDNILENIDPRYSYERFTYKKGLLTEETDGHTLEKYEYNPNGDMIYNNVYREYGGLKKRTVNNFLDGNLVKVSEYNISIGAPSLRKQVTTYEYDESGNVVKEHVKRKNDRVDKTTYFAHSILYHPNTKMKSKVTWTNGIITEELNYDEEGRLISKFEQYSSMVHYEYDNNNLLIKEYTDDEEWNYEYK
jgi:hypothetical protein